MTAPEILYHYTTAEGLMGIVQSQTLRATDADFLNDAQELQFGRRELHDALRKQADELSPKDSEGGGENYSRATVMRSAADHLAPGLGLVAREDADPASLDVVSYARRQYHFVYVTCFCEEGDLLSQWRGYGAPGGYAVGFRASQLRLVRPGETGARTEQFGLTDETATLVQVRYGDAAAQDAITSVLRTVAPEPVGFPGAQGYARAQSIVLPALAGIKHAAFSEEREWRLVTVSDQHEPCFRPGPLGVTPHIRLRYPAEAIAEVVIGPGGPEPQLRERGVQRLVGEDVAVRSSSAPFRG